MGLDKSKMTAVGISCPNEILSVIDKIKDLERRPSRSNTCVFLIELGIEEYKRKNGLQFDKK